MKPTIFAVEDDSALQELYTYSLENDFCFYCFADANALYDALENATPSLIMLDVMLPGEDGFAILSRLKADKKTANIPVIIISAKSEELSKVKGLNMGADDYLSKPFGVMELIARIKANLRKNGKQAENTVYKDVVIDSSKRQITANGKVISVTLKEYNLLKLFCQNAERVQERDAIFNEVWGENYVGETRTLDIHVKEIRRKLAQAESETEIKTIRGVGYMII